MMKAARARKKELLPFGRGDRDPWKPWEQAGTKSLVKLSAKLLKVHYSDRVEVPKYYLTAPTG